MEIEGEETKLAYLFSGNRTVSLAGFSDILGNSLKWLDAHNKNVTSDNTDW